MGMVTMYRCGSKEVYTYFLFILKCFFGLVSVIFLTIII